MDDIVERQRKAEEAKRRRGGARRRAARESGHMSRGAESSDEVSVEQPADQGQSTIVEQGARGALSEPNEGSLPTHVAVAEAQTGNGEAGGVDHERWLEAARKAAAEREARRKAEEEARRAREAEIARLAREAEERRLQKEAEERARHEEAEKEAAQIAAARAALTGGGSAPAAERTFHRPQVRHDLIVVAQGKDKRPKAVQVERRGRLWRPPVQAAAQEKPREVSAETEVAVIGDRQALAVHGGNLVERAQRAAELLKEIDSNDPANAERVRQLLHEIRRVAAVAEMRLVKPSG